MVRMTNDEIDCVLRWYEQGLDAEDIFERFNEEIPFGKIVEVISIHEEALADQEYMGGYY